MIPPSTTPFAPRVVVVKPDEICGPGERFRPQPGLTFGEAGLTTDVYSPCYPYKCLSTCAHAAVMAAGPGQVVRPSDVARHRGLVHSQQDAS